jgi:hypothetical protein
VDGVRVNGQLRVINRAVVFPESCRVLYSSTPIPPNCSAEGSGRSLEAVAEWKYNGMRCQAHWDYALNDPSTCCTNGSRFGSILAYDEDGGVFRSISRCMTLSDNLYEAMREF